ncbi:MAG: glycosyltransferase, partial [Betaproteobacteria bacterium]|nr:glycosyltransferase [Betaproteobacteria bacterium]
MTEDTAARAPRNNGALVSLIITVYNGANVLDETFARLLELEKELKKSAPDAEMEIIAVDDASDDDSFAVILRRQKRLPHKIRAVRFAKNCGPMAAAQAGIEYARGDCAAVLPQDLQDPPESIL